MFSGFGYGCQRFDGSPSDNAQLAVVMSMNNLGWEWMRPETM